MSEISAGGKTFKKGEIISYEVEKDAPREFVVVGKSKDNPSGLILKNVANNRQFAINAASVAAKVKKIPQPQKIAPPQEAEFNPGPGAYTNPGANAGGYGTSSSGQIPSGQGGRGSFWGKLKPVGGKVKDFHESMGGSSRVALEVLIALAIFVHIADAFWLGFSTSAVNIGYRTLMYFVLCLAAHVILNKGWDTKDSIIELIKVSAIPLFIVPIISIILNWLVVPDKVVELISTLTLAFPIWLFYILYVREARTTVDGGFFKKSANLLFTPSGWSKIWFFILVVAVLYNMVTLMGVTASSIPGADVSGFDIKTSTEGLTKFLGTSIEKMSISVSSFIKGAQVGFKNLKNDTLGEYYTGQVEQNKELTGIFITSFAVNGKQYDSMPIMAYGYIRARSFVEGVNMKASCYAQDIANKTIIYQGRADPTDITNIYIEDQRGVLCTFDEGINGKRGLPAGKYHIFLVLEFNFETWAYKQFYFLDRNYIVYLRTNGENPNAKLGIPLTTKTVYTNGPLMIGMDDRLEMPFAISSSDINYIPIGMTLDNKPLTYGVKGEVLKVKKYTLRLPNAIAVDTNACTIDEGRISSTADNISGYTLYTFSVPEDSLAGTYMTLNCNLIIEKDAVQKIIPGANTPAMVSVIGTAAYDYKLSKMILVTVEKTPGT